MIWAKQIKNFATEVAAAVAARLLPTGGTTGQVLTKSSGTDFDATWTTPAAATQAKLDELEALNWFL